MLHALASHTNMVYVTNGSVLYMCVSVGEFVTSFGPFHNPLQGRWSK